MQECFIIRRGGTDASRTELSEHLKGTIQIDGELNPITFISGSIVEESLEMSSDALNT